jgi:p-cumate 2,3-dioxygenase subunit beta
MSGQSQWRLDEVEAFLVAEMKLLDNWSLDDWFKLFTEDCTYVIPTTDLPDGDPAKDMVFVDDNHIRLEGRVRKLKSNMAHREVPRSRTRHFISNVQIVEESEGNATVEAYFQVYRFKGTNKEPFVGTYRYELTRRNGNIMIRHRRATLDLENLQDQGAISIIL